MLPSASGLKSRLVSVRGRVRSKRCSAKINDSTREFAHSKSLAIASRSSASSDDRDPFRPRPRFTLPGAHAAAPPPSVLLALSRSPPPRIPPCALHRARRGSAQVKAAYPTAHINAIALKPITDAPTGSATAEANDALRRPVIGRELVRTSQTDFFGGHVRQRGLTYQQALTTDNP